MNKQLVIGGIIGAVAVTAIGGVASYNLLNSGNYAEVVSVRPAMKTVSIPREDCHDEIINREKPTKDPHQVAGTIAGAVIGGVLGSKVGKGKGKDIATVGGAVAGGYAGNKIQENMQERNSEQELQQVCRTVYDSQEQQDGYEVTYRLDGQERSVHMDHDPGSRIALENGEINLESNG